MPRWHLTRKPLELQIEQPVFAPEELAAEEWRAIPGYVGHYEVSNLGRVKTLKTYHNLMPGRILRVGTMAAGYFKVTLYINSKPKTWPVHKLVALAFIGPCPPKHEVNHKEVLDDRVEMKRNNRATNLEYLTKKGNMQHAAKNGLTPRGNRHGLRIWDAAAKGDDHGLRKHPERVSRGDQHWTRRIKGAQRGEKNNSAKLTDEQRKAILEDYIPGVFGYDRLSKRYGVHRTTIAFVIKNFKPTKS